MTALKLPGSSSPTFQTAGQFDFPGRSAHPGELTGKVQGIQQGVQESPLLGQWRGECPKSTEASTFLSLADQLTLFLLSNPLSLFLKAVNSLLDHTAGMPIGSR